MRIVASEAPAPSTELAVISAAQSIVPAEFFKAGGSQQVLAAIKEEVRKQAQALDISTEAGRKAIASLAYKVARSKTALDETGASLGEEHLRAKQAIDAERRTVRQELDELKDEVRKPLTDWENAEKKRVKDHEDAIDLLETELLAAPQRKSIADIQEHIQFIGLFYQQRDWQEFKQRASSIFSRANDALAEACSQLMRANAEREELERLRAEAEAQRQRERDEAIAKAAREEAERKAEEQARVAREAAQREQARIEYERVEAEARAKQAEAQRIAQAEQAERDRADAERRLQEAEDRRKREAKEAQERAEAAERRAEQTRKDAADEARMKEVQRQDAERKALAESIAKRERNRRHREMIHAEIHKALMGCIHWLGKDDSEALIDAVEADAIVAALIEGKIPHVTVNY